MTLMKSLTLSTPNLSKGQSKKLVVAVRVISLVEKTLKMLSYRKKKNLHKVVKILRSRALMNMVRRTTVGRMAVRKRMISCRLKIQAQGSRNRARKSRLRVREVLHLHHMRNSLTCWMKGWMRQLRKIRSRHRRCQSICRISVGGPSEGI